VIKEWFNIWLFLLCAVILLTFVVISMEDDNGGFNANFGDD